MVGYDSMATPVAKRLEGKVALITGGASGIGEATARLFVQHGAKVLIADIQDELGQSICKKLGLQGTISYVHCDVTSDSDVENAVDSAISLYGKLDIMYNNAGIAGNESKILNTTIENFKRVLDVNVIGAFLGAKHAARVMIPAEKGCILFTSSVASVICSGETSHSYAISKHALVGLTKNLSVELGQHGIRVNCISPHGIATPLLRKSLGNLDKKKVEELVSFTSNLKGVVLEEEDIAEAALFLASDESKYVTGMNMVIDGGFSITNPSVTMALKSLSS